MLLLVTNLKTSRSLLSQHAVYQILMFLVSIFYLFISILTDWVGIRSSQEFADRIKSTCENFYDALNNLESVVKKKRNQIKNNAATTFLLISFMERYDNFVLVVVCNLFLFSLSQPLKSIFHCWVSDAFPSGVDMVGGCEYQSPDFNEEIHSCWLEAENRNITKVFAVGVLHSIISFV